MSFGGRIMHAVLYVIVAVIFVACENAALNALQDHGKNPVSGKEPTYPVDAKIHDRNPLQ